MPVSKINKTCVYLRGRYRASECQIWHVVMGSVGVGEMDADVERNGTVRWRGVASAEIGKQNATVSECYIHFPGLKEPS